MKKFKLEKCHLDFLLLESTLKTWSGYSIPERCLLFHRKFPDKRVSTSGLLRLYKKHGITRKKVRMFKTPKNVTLHDYLADTKRCRDQVKDALDKQLPIIYVDETVFTKKTYFGYDYTPKYVSAKVD